MLDLIINSKKSHYKRACVCKNASVIIIWISQEANRFQPFLIHFYAYIYVALTMASTLGIAHVNAISHFWYFDNEMWHADSLNFLIQHSCHHVTIHVLKEDMPTLGKETV